MIVHVEYRCPECDKVFNCPANLASHRRWHKPKTQTSPQSPTQNQEEENNNKVDSDNEGYTCEFCMKSFKRANSLRKHLIQNHQTESQSSSKPNKYSIAELLSPTKQEKQPNSIPCFSCKESFGNMAEFSHHLSTSHSKKAEQNSSIHHQYIPLFP